MHASLRNGPAVDRVAQALQVEWELGLKDTIGEWVPLSEPGESEYVDKKEGCKWISGLRWSDIVVDERTVRCPSKNIEKPSFKCPLIRQAISQITNKFGPLIISESTNRPYRTHNFGRTWRKIATAAGVPTSVQNVNARGKPRSPKAAARPPTVVSDAIGRHLWEKADAALPKWLRDPARSEVRQELIVAVWSGDILEEAMQEKASKFLSDHYGDRYKTVSIDQPLPGTENLTYSDLLSRQD